VISAGAKRLGWPLVPELPETETIARDLNEMIAGARFRAIEAPRLDVLREADLDAWSDVIAGASVQRVWRRAKLIVLDLSDRDESTSWHIVVQPRFTGGLIVDSGALTETDRAYVCVTWRFADGRALHYRDVRRLGTVALMSPARFAEYSGGLGGEPLDPAFTIVEFSVCVRASRQAIKVTLMDQRRLAGVGNIYANEALWWAGIDPSREAASLSPAEAGALFDALRAVLTASIAARGTSFRDYRDARGERGGFVEQLAAYGRDGQPCRRCHRRLVGTHAIDGRGTVFCPTCQR